jgi:nitrite reductase (NADH) large subunit
MKIVVAGHGMVGHQFLQSLAETGLTDAQVTVLCEKPARPTTGSISEFFAGKSAQDLSLVEPGFFERTGFDLRLAARAASVDRRVRTVTTADGEVLPYDKLVLATGSVPFVPPIAGRDGRTASSTAPSTTWRPCRPPAPGPARRGGGRRPAGPGMRQGPARPGPGNPCGGVRPAPDGGAGGRGGGRILREKIEALGVRAHRRSTTQITDGAEHRHRMVFEDGSHLETDMIVFSAGIRPRDELARQCVLAIGPRGGVVIDDHCRSSDPHVYAIGECASWNEQTFGLVAPGYEMARVAARHIAGEASAAFAGADMSTKLKLMGVDVASIGDAHGKTPHCRSFSFTDELNGVYKKIVVSEDGRQLLGAVLVGDAAEYGTLLQMALNGIALPEHPEFLILPASDGQAKPGLGVDALPDSAQICSCNNVSKGQIARPWPAAPPPSPR